MKDVKINALIGLYNCITVGERSMEGAEPKEVIQTKEIRAGAAKRTKREP